MQMASIPLLIHQRQRGQRVDLKWLRARAQDAVPLCVEHLKFPDAALAQLFEVEVSILSDKAIAQVHADFLDDPTPTDVITFHHGEILVSADTAALAGPEHGHTVTQELLLYIIHGLMHLAGWEDEDPEECAEMHRRQDAVLAAVMRD
jgi:probable rRNA maturation factor